MALDKFPLNNALVEPMLAVPLKVTNCVNITIFSVVVTVSYVTNYTNVTFLSVVTLEVPNYVK
jgi:hypothetical protein